VNREKSPDELIGGDSGDRTPTCTVWANREEKYLQALEKRRNGFIEEEKRRGTSDESLTI